MLVGCIRWYLLFCFYVRSRLKGHRHYADRCGRLAQVTTAFSNQIHSWRIRSACFHEICEYRSRHDWDSVLEMEKDEYTFWSVSHFCQTERMNVVPFKCACHSQTVSVCARFVGFADFFVTVLHIFIHSQLIRHYCLSSFSNQNYPKRLEVHFTRTITCCNVILMLYFVCDWHCAVLAQTEFQYIFPCVADTTFQVSGHQGVNGSGIKWNVVCESKWERNGVSMRERECYIST